MRTVWGTRTLCPRWRCLKSAVAPLTATATRTSPGGCPPSCQSAQAMITGLDHVQVAAPPGCEAEARGFYGALLGLSELDKPPALAGRGGAWFGCGAQQLHVGVAGGFLPPPPAPPPPPRAPPAAPPPPPRLIPRSACPTRRRSTRSRCGSPRPARPSSGTTRCPACGASTPGIRGATGSSCSLRRATAPCQHAERAERRALVHGRRRALDALGRVVCHHVHHRYAGEAGHGVREIGPPPLRALPGQGGDDDLVVAHRVPHLAERVERRRVAHHALAALDAGLPPRLERGLHALGRG